MILSAEPAIGSPGAVRRVGALPWPFACPTCHGPLESAPETVDGAAASQAASTADPAGAPSVLCPEHGAYPSSQGIWRFLTPEGWRRYGLFMEEYATVRRAEGRGSENPEYYRALPFEDRSGRLSQQWRIRAATYRSFVARVLVPLERERGRTLDVVDLGAGNGWLSYRLAERGHRCAAVDLGDDPWDGLGAHPLYGESGGHPRFTPIQADFDRLPLTDACADLVVFNSSLHYSTDFDVTLAEALRVLRPEGQLVVFDSPVYADFDAGQAMVQEREAHFQERYGFRSNAIPSENFLTPDRLDELATSLGIRWHITVPFLGVRWALRPWIARLKRRRAPSSFWLLTGTRDPELAVRLEYGEWRAPVRPRGVLPSLWRGVLRARYLLFQRRRHRGPSWERVQGRTLLVLPGVFNPRLFRTGEFLARHLYRGRVRPGSSVLDMGTGTGVGAIVAAERAWRVVAVDVNPEAVRCARINVLMAGLEGRVEVREGDLFEGLMQDERFDLVLFNPPFFRGEPESPSDAAWRGVDVAERFAAGLRERLNPDGHALVVLSSDGDAAGWLRALHRASFAIEAVADRDLVNEVLVLYRVRPR